MLGGRHFVVVLFRLHAQLAHDGQHFAAQVLGGVDRVDREIAALGTRAVTHVAFGIGLGRVARQFDGVERIAGAVGLGVPLHVVEDEELGFRAEEHGVADARSLDVVQGRLGDRAGVAVVGGAGVGVHHVAEQRQGRLLIERVDDRGRQVWTQLHVRLVDRLPAGDRRAVEHGAVVEEVVIDQIDVKRDVLHLAAHVGETNVNVFDVLFLDQVQDFLGGAHSVSPS